MREILGKGEDCRLVMTEKGHVIRIRVPRLTTLPITESSPALTTFKRKES